MGSLKQFLEEEAGKLQTYLSEAARKRDEWVGAVDRLTSRMKEWIGEADSGGVLVLQDRMFTLREEGIGAYEIHGLSIGLGPREIRLEPVARNVAGPHSATGVIHVSRAYGRVDMTDGLRKFVIFRLEREPEERWNIIEQDSYAMQLFNQQSFEAAVQSLLE
ncbi:MAG: hypothetical protein WKF75_18600 [Singulisphaera sp.]